MHSGGKKSVNRHHWTHGEGGGEERGREGEGVAAAVCAEPRLISLVNRTLIGFPPREASVGAAGGLIKASCASPGNSAGGHHDGGG